MRRSHRETDGDADAAEPHRGSGAGRADVYADWEAVYEDNVRRIHRLMYSKVGNRPDAEDLTSQVFVSALRSLRITATIGEVRAYLLATARTVLAGHWQKTLGRPVTTLDEDLVEPGGGWAAGTDATDRRAEERAAHILAGLPERYREILTLRFFLGHDVRAAAAAMGVTVANAKVLQHRALRRAAALAAGPDES